MINIERMNVVDNISTEMQTTWKNSTYVPFMDIFRK